MQASYSSLTKSLGLTMPALKIQDSDRGPAVMVVIWTESAVAVLIVAMRYYARTLIRKHSWDDLLMLVTLVCVFRYVETRRIVSFGKFTVNSASS